MKHFSKDYIIELLKSDTTTQEVFSLANSVREQHIGDKIFLRGLIEFSNICKRQCKYCGLRCENQLVKRYRMSKEEILLSANQAINLGYKTIVLQSGEDDYFSGDKLCEIIHEIKKLDTAVTLSIGEKSFDEYKAYKLAGADRFLLRIETTDEMLYKKMHPTSDFKNRVRCLADLKSLGYEVGTGCLVGLPKQTVESLADDILFFKEIDADMIGIGPFIAHPQTPLKDLSNGNFDLALKVMAITRILIPDANIPATTAMETLRKNGGLIALQCGANVVMPNVTPFKYRENYEIYPGKNPDYVSLKQQHQNLENKLHSIKRNIVSDYGFRQKSNFQA